MFAWTTSHPKGTAKHERISAFEHARPGGLIALGAALVLIGGGARAQTDSLFLNNGNVIVGELKDMVRGVATVETKYSDSDFKIEWTGVRMARTTSRYLVELEDGQRITARLQSVDTAVVKLVGDADPIITALQEVVYLRSVKPDFWSRASIAIDLGYSFTKANNLQQFSLRSGLGYQTDRWLASATFNKVISKQDGVADIERTDLDGSFRWSLPKRFFAGIDAAFLANTEQLLTLRSSIQPSVGNYLLHNNSMYLLVLGGMALTHEDFSTEDPDRDGTEGLMGIELNLFDAGDLSLLLSSKAFPSFTESGRWRMDHRFDIKYDLPKDLYIRMGLTLNYDNRPVAGGSETDYVYQLAIGWEL